MIIPTWKKIGESTHLLAQKIGAQIAAETGNPEDFKATHTGTLDPMAEGVIVVLTGNDRFKKSEYSQSLKVYEFTVVFGFSTDSHDLLGLTQEIAPQQLETETLYRLLTKELPGFIGIQTQMQPTFSAQRVGGNSGFELAKKGQTFSQKINDIEIHSIIIEKKSEISLKTFEKNLIEKISLVTGDFRQAEILAKWRKTITELEEKGVVSLPLFTLKATVSKRTYIRAITRDLAKKIGIPATTVSITRTQNAGFDAESCQTLL